MVVPQQNALAICRAALADSKAGGSDAAAKKRLSKAASVLAAAVEKVQNGVYLPLPGLSRSHLPFDFAATVWRYGGGGGGGRSGGGAIDIESPMMSSSFVLRAVSRK